MVKWCIVKCYNGKEGRVGEQKIWEFRKHGRSPFRRHSSVSNFVLLPRLVLDWLGPDCKIGSTHASALWATVTPTYTAVAVVARYRHCRLLPHCCLRRRPLPLPPPAAAAAGRSRRRLTLSTTAASAASAVGCYCCRLRPLSQQINRFNIYEKK